MSFFLRQWLRLGAVAAILGTAQASVIERIVLESTVTGVPVSQEQVNQCLVSAPRSTFDPAILSEDIKRLFQSGNYEDVQKR